MKISEKFPQILFLSSRTEEGIDKIIRRVKTVNITPEFAALSNDVFSKEIKGHMHRGYAIVDSEATQISHKMQVHGYLSSTYFSRDQPNQHNTFTCNGSEKGVLKFSKTC